RHGLASAPRALVSPLPQREANVEASSAIGGIVHLDLTAVQHDDLTADRQSQPHARRVQLSLTTEEAFEEMRPLGGRNPRPVIAHTDDRLASDLPELNLNGSTVRGILEPVIEEVGEHLLQA